MSANILVGTSGWAYKEWRGAFYPEQLAESKFLDFYSRHLASVEVNFTFRRKLLPQTAHKWVSLTPPSFNFSFKAPQSITHYKRLRADSIREPLAAFVESVSPFAEAGKLGALLFQVPHNLFFDLPLLEDFLAALPRDHRLAVEFRHASWLREESYAALRKFNVALCHTQGTGELSTPDLATADFLYWRLRTEKYAPAALKSIAARLKDSASPAYIYFKHEDAATGPKFATRLSKLLGTSVVTPQGAAEVR